MIRSDRVLFEKPAQLGHWGFFSPSQVRVDFDGAKQRKREAVNEDKQGLRELLWNKCNGKGTTYEEGE